MKTDDLLGLCFIGSMIGALVVASVGRAFLDEYSVHAMSGWLMSASCAAFVAVLVVGTIDHIAPLPAIASNLLVVALGFLMLALNRFEPVTMTELTDVDLSACGIVLIFLGAYQVLYGPKSRAPRRTS